jgi:hypothetical protein
MKNRWREGDIHAVYNVDALNLSAFVKLRLFLLAFQGLGRIPYTQARAVLRALS